MGDRGKAVGEKGEGSVGKRGGKWGMPTPLSTPSELISSEAPIKPRGGDMFVIDSHLFSNTLSRRIDQYQWVNDGSKKHQRQ